MTIHTYLLVEEAVVLSSAKPKKEISILLPAYNEALQIEKCVREVDRAVSSFSGSYEIIVVEDGSTDGTEVVLAGLLNSVPNLSFQHSPVRLGKGKAIKNALNSAKGEVIVFMDVDLATNLSHLPQVLKLVEKNGGLVIGSRHVEGARVRRGASRTMFSLAYNLLVRVLFLDSVHDHQCGFKAMRHEVAEALGDVKSNGYFFDTEMILQCKKSGFPVVEVGVEWSENRMRDTSKVRLFHDAARMGIDLLKYKFSADENHPS
jgi:glycosyltransferase involved in cell wall biosynthesis